MGDPRSQPLSRNQITLLSTTRNHQIHQPAQHQQDKSPKQNLTISIGTKNQHFPIHPFFLFQSNQTTLLTNPFYSPFHPQDQISSYSTLKTQPCQTCSKILDPKLRFPVIRRDETPNNNSSSSTSSSSTLPETKSKTHDDKTDNGNGTGKLDNEGEAKTQSITTGIESQHNRNSNRNKSRKWGVYHIGCI